MTRLKGTPSQMFAMITAVSAVSGEVSQLIWVPPNASMTELMIPWSLLSIHAQVEDETIRGRSHGTRNRARSTPESRKFAWKNTARASPIAYWKAIETRVNRAVLTRAGPKAFEVNTSAYFSKPANAGSPWTK